MEDELLGSFAPESEEDDDAVSHGAEPSVASDTSSIADALDVLGIVDVAYETAFVSSMDVDVVKTFEIILAPRVEELQVDALGVGIEYEEVEGPTCVAQLEVQTSRFVGLRSLFLKNCVPLWGYISIRGRRPEMEDVVIVVPHFFDIPLRMLIGDCDVDELKPSKITLTSHFFGVYDGHGGSQVANYCQEHIHLALLNKLRNLMEHSEWIIGNDDCQKQWEKAFSDCFLKVDDEVGGKVRKEDDFGSSSEASVVGLVAPETVGSAVGGELVRTGFATATDKFWNVIVMLESVELSFVLEHPCKVLDRDVLELFQNAKLRREDTIIKCKVGNLSIKVKASLLT
ncbi:putative protein phosphatase 2C 6 [Platanthera guangdongensis]|uniref:protein-serine/threonine phosphatase n=1 Tax=Platanthera guangdongensis TaxID=2320717 RepID=A0ABR2LJ64_9ASPA